MDAINPAFSLMAMANVINTYDPSAELRSSVQEKQDYLQRQVLIRWKLDRERRDYFAFIQRLHDFNQQMMKLYAEENTKSDKTNDLTNLASLAEVTGTDISKAVQQTEEQFDEILEDFASHKTRESKEANLHFAKYLHVIVNTTVNNPA
jgi:hypothetical protein